MTPTHTKKQVNVRAFVFNGIIDSLDQDHVDAKLYAVRCDKINTVCEKCNQHFDDHACIKTISGEAVVCPGDYVINNPQFPDYYYQCKPDIFESTYDDIEYTTYSNDACEDMTHNCDDEDISLKALKLRAAEVLLNNSSRLEDRKVSINFMRRLIEGTSRLEQENDGMLFGEIMALINENSEILVSRKAYDIDYIFFNSETSQFMAYKDGRVKLHSFNTKDYTANDWYIVN